MLTLCWAAKGGSGTSVVVASLALTAAGSALAVDIAGDLPYIFGVGPPATPGLLDWMASDAPPERLSALETQIRGEVALVHRGHLSHTPHARWLAAVQHWADDDRFVIVDAGTQPPARLLAVTEATKLLVTRACYLSLRQTANDGVRPDGVILINEPGRQLKANDIERSVGAPVVAVVEYDPRIARAVDAGLLAGRLPGGLRHSLRQAA